MNLKNNLKFILFFAFAIVLFQWELIAMKAIFIKGDNLVQFYPWFKVYAESIKHFTFPFWTQYMQSGFPLMAEGQVGGYYPFNIFFFFFLPFNMAHNYAIVFHFIVAGISMYLLTRKLGACEWGGTLAAIVFCFGSAYAGCFYNIITLRVLSWTPLVFLLFELFFERRKTIYIVMAGIVFGMQFLAGFVQLALYCWFFYSIYFLYRARILKDTLYLALFSSIAFILFIPQLILTYRLALLSSRTSADLGFALWGSYNPLFMAQAVFPYLGQFLRSDIYFSVSGLLFLISSFYLLKKDRKIAAIFIIFVLSFLLALGKYNPIYVLLVKIFKLYNFRNPAKFLFFTAMAASVLIGRGFSEFTKDNFKHKNGALKIYAAVLCLCGLMFIVSKIVLTGFKDGIIRMGERYAANFVFGTSAHRHDLSIYIGKVHQIYALMSKGFSLESIFNVTSWVLLIVSLAASLFIMKKRSLRIGFYPKLILICAVMLDLYIYSFIGKGLRNNMDSPDILKPAHAAIYDYIKNDKDLFRVLPYGIGSDVLPSWIMPNANMIHKIDSVAGYTPLANGYYRKALLSLEIVDNSLGVRPPKKGSIDDNLNLLKALNVKYIVSAEKLEKPYLQMVIEEEGLGLYQIKDHLPRAFILKDLDLSSVDRNIKVEVIEYKSGKAIFDVNMPYNGFLVFSENNYPGWGAYINGRPGKIKPLSLVNAVELNEGANSVIFIYETY